MNSSSLCSLAGRYDNSVPTWFLAPNDGLKIPAQEPRSKESIHPGWELIFGLLKRFINSGSSSSRALLFTQQYSLLYFIMPKSNQKVVFATNQLVNNLEHHYFVTCKTVELMSQRHKIFKTQILLFFCKTTIEILDQSFVCSPLFLILPILCTMKIQKKKNTKHFISYCI